MVNVDTLVAPVEPVKPIVPVEPVAPIEPVEPVLPSAATGLLPPAESVDGMWAQSVQFNFGGQEVSSKISSSTPTALEGQTKAHQAHQQLRADYNLDELE